MEAVIKVGSKVKQYGVIWEGHYSICELEEGEIGDYGNFTFKEAKQWIRERLISDIDALNYQLGELRSLSVGDI